MAWWMAIPAVMQAAGTYMGAQANSQAAKFEQRQLNAQAMGERATASRVAAEAARQSRLLESRAIALNAASGGGGADPSFINALADINAVGEFNALSALYEGETSARSLEMQGRARRWEAKQMQRQSILTAGAQLGQGYLNTRGYGGQSMFEKYGGGGFKGSSSGTYNRKGLGMSYSFPQG